jgi:hypothetical protein
MNKLKLFKNSHIMYDNIIPKNKIGCELGVCMGENAAHLFLSTKPSLLYLVDLWEGPKDGEKSPHYNRWRGGDHSDDVRLKFKEEEEQGRVKLIKYGTVRFLDTLDDNYLDWVYLDSDHQYGHVSRELDRSFKKVKKGGIIMGHDFCFQGYYELGVIAPVIEACQAGKMTMIALTREPLTSWACINNVE